MYQPDFIHNFVWLAENESGVAKYFRQADARFQNENRNVVVSNNSQEAGNFLLNQQINRFLGTKLYNRAFLSDNGIKFNESLADEEAELFFQLECFLKSKYFIYVQNACYIAPKNSLERYPAAKFHDVSNDDAQVISKFKAYFTARIDIQLVPKTTNGDFQILYVSDDRASIVKPDWFQKDGIGYVIQSYSGKIKIIVKATVKGQIVLVLRGIYARKDYTRKDSEFVPYWIDYTKLTVNGKPIFNKLTPAWHNRYYPYNMDVKAGDEIIVEVEWLPHRSDT